FQHVDAPRPHNGIERGLDDAPIRQDRDEGAFAQSIVSDEGRREHDSEPILRRLDQHIAIIAVQPAIDADVGPFALAGETPDILPREIIVDKAIVPGQILWLFWSAAPFEIGGRDADRHARRGEAARGQAGIAEIADAY